MINLNTRPIEVLKPLIAAAYDFATQNPGLPFVADHQHAIEEAVGLIDRGKVRVASPTEGGKWETHIWLKQAILLYFRLQFIEEIQTPPFQWCDKIPIKRWTMDMGVRVVPPATVRFGAFVGKGAVLMPSYVNIGAFVDEGSMIDTWATVGSCAQVGKNVHISGGVGIGGVLEPPQASPVLIEDDCFIGSRCIVVEGVHVKRGAVLGAGVVLTQSTPILDVRGPNPVISKGVIPENCVVIPGSYPKAFPAGEFQVPCALIIGTRSASTDRKTSLNKVLREFEVPV
jgi:2,3,4,5-tetrahydropyridine-2-carboxylate N-succinyltransferase